MGEQMTVIESPFLDRGSTPLWDFLPLGRSTCLKKGPELKTGAAMCGLNAYAPKRHLGRSVN